MTIGSSQIEQYKLHNILHAFAHDENLEVRMVISSSLHEVGSCRLLLLLYCNKLRLIQVAKIFGKSGSIYIRAAFSKLITDEEIDVLKVVFKNMSAILTQIYGNDSQKKVHGLKMCHKTVINNVAY